MTAFVVAPNYRTIEEEEQQEYLYALASGSFREEKDEETGV